MYSFFILCLATYNRSLFLIEKHISYRRLLLISQDKKNRKGFSQFRLFKADFFQKSEKKGKKYELRVFLTIFVTTELSLYSAINNSYKDTNS